MTANDLIAAFETLADAPDGVKRLRELVLHLAMRGKLVPQDPTEKRVAPSTSPPSAGEAPFDLPETWRWLRLPEVADYAVGKTPATKEPRFWGAREIPWVSIGDMPDGGVVTTTTRTVSAAAANEVFRRPPAKAGTLLMSFKLTIGKMAVLGVDAYHNEAIISITPNPRATRDYLLRVLPMMALGGESKDAIMGATLNGQSLARILIPLPPLAEQHRIVTRVDELMGLLDRLEAARTARDDVRRAARDASLAALRDADDTEAVEAAWGRIAGQMDALFAEPEDVGPLRQAVLGLAVRGRLVPQDAKDEQISVPLARTRRERARLIEQKALRRTEPIDAEYPVPLARVPAGWAWARPDELCALERYALAIGPFGSDLVKSDYRPTGVPLVFVREITSESFGGPATKYVEEAKADELHAHKVRAGDLLITKMGAPPGDTAIYPDGCAEAVITADCIKFRPHRALCLVGYLKYLYRAPVIRAAMLEITMGIAHQKMSLKRFRATAVPVPPLAEQHRIVAKVDALMAICDALEARLATARDLHGQFAAAAVHHLDV